MAEFVCNHGGQVHLETPVAGVWCDERKLDLHDGRRREAHASGRRARLELADGRRLPFDHVISTMPLTGLVKGMGDVPDDVAAATDALSYRNTTLVYLLVAGTDLFADQWLYIHSPELLAGRITNFRNWAPELHGGAALASWR